MTYMTTSEKIKCEFCEKEFRKESTLGLHVCEKKRRAMQKEEPGVQLGFQAYLRFYELAQGSSKNKTYQVFADSPYYNAFIKFGRHIRAIRAIAPARFVDYVLKNVKKIDHWCKDENYQNYLMQYLRSETVNDALERTIQTSVNWAEENNSTFNHMFLYGNANKLCFLITQGRISPWAVYHSNSGQQFLGKLNEEHLAIIFDYVNPDVWNKTFKERFADVIWAKETLQQAGF